jgi:PAS domain S-box-containing protein
VEVDTPRETPLSHSFCKYVVMNDAPVIVNDLRDHPVLKRSPALQEFGVLAYAGVPVHGPDGEVLGAMCLVDVQVVEWSEQQISVLHDMARSVETDLALRLRHRDVEVAGARLHQAIDGAAQTGFIAADRDGVITVVNQAAEKLCGATAAELVGKRTLDQLPQLFRHAAPASLGLEGDTAAPSQVLELRGPSEWIVENDLGARRIVSVRLTVLRDARGRKDGYVLVGNDVTAHHQTQAALQDVIGKQADAVDRLVELDRARNDFIATASHELRTPVTSILGFTELLTDGAAGDLTADQTRLLDRVDRNGKRLLHLVEDLFNLSSLDARGPAVLERTIVDAAAPGMRAWKAVQPLLRGRRLEADLVVAEGLPSVFGDVIQLERAIHHLLTNSVKFTPDGGRITFSIVRDVDDVVFDVTDTGVGICEDEHAALFDPFFRTREAHSLAAPGAGLGLAVVRGIVEAHEGEVDVTSRRDAGTTVRIRMPVLPALLDSPRRVVR